MENRRTAAQAEPAERRASPTHDVPPSDAAGLESWLATPAIVILVVACCAAPLLIGALVATGAVAWLAAHGYAIGAAALLVVAAVLAWRIRVRLSRG